MTDQTQTSKNNKVLITSALPYVNNVPHLGNIIGCVLSADVFARYCRLKGLDTLYVCGTDEHGTATETKALEEGLSPKEICDKYYAIHKDIYEWFGCSFDVFGRTSTTVHRDVTQSIFKRVYDNGFITKKEVEQLFCEKCDKFLSDRFVEGECPHCNYSDARGDQCDGCGKLLNGVELIKPACKVCKGIPVVKTSDHLFLDLPKLSVELDEWFDAQSEIGDWPLNARRITKSWIKEGLKERCISRDLKWGVHIPLEGYEDKVFYVWFDAPIGYISITKSAREDWSEWWHDSNIPLYQFMAKDNVPFHSIIFPATLKSTRDPWNTLHHLASTEYLNYENGKFSKSRNQGVFGTDAKESGIPADVWRYYLLINRPENADTQFTWKDFQEKNNNELLANLGNFVNRALTFANNNFEGKIPKIELSESDKEFVFEINSSLKELKRLFDSVKLKDSLKTIMHISRLGNQYFQSNEPWAVIKTDSARAGTVIGICANLVHLLGLIVRPFLPFTSDAIGVQLDVDYSDACWPEEFKMTLEEGYELNETKVLFSKLEDKFIVELREKFSGVKQGVQDSGSDGVCDDSDYSSADPFSKADLRVAEVLSVDDHPDAEKLYVLNIKLGELNGVVDERQLVAGLKGYLTKEDILGKKIIIVANLKPAKLRGIESQGMLLAAEKGDNVVLLQAKNSNPGDSVFVDGVESKPCAELDFKEFMKIELIVGADKKVIYGSGVLKTELEFVEADIEEGALIR